MKKSQIWKHLDRGTRLAIMTLAVILAAFMIMGVVLRHASIENLMPPPGSARYDVRTIYMAPLASICPGLPVAGFEPELEHCVQSIRLDDDALRPSAFEALALPTFEEFQQGKVAGFKALLALQGKQHLLKLIQRGESYLLGMSIPSQYFSLRSFGDEPYSLGFHVIRDANVCIDGRCSNYSNWRQGNGTSSIPLYRYPEGAVTAPEKSRSVFFAANDGKIPVGLALNQGLFIAKDETHIERRRYFTLSEIVRPASVIFFLTAFLIITLTVGAITGYLDYASLAYFIASVLAAITALTFKHAMTEWQAADYWKLQWAILLNVLLAATLFAVATIREKWRIVAVAALVAIGYAAIAAVVFLVLPAAASNYVDDQWTHLRLWSLALALVPGSICFLDSWRLTRRAAKTLRVDKSLSIRSRVADQIRLGSNFLAMGLSSAYVCRDGQAMSTIVSAIFPWVGLFITVPMIVLIHGSHRRQVRNDRQAASRSESAAIEIGHGAAEAAKYRATERSSVMPIIDLANSTKVTDELDSDMHWVMQSLGRVIRRTLAELDLICHYDKRNGDCILTLASSGQGLEADFERMISTVRRDVDLRYRRVVKFFHPDLDIHLVLLAIPSYKLGAPPDPRTFDKKQLEKLMIELLAGFDIPESADGDFIGSTPNYLMKYLADLKVETGLMVLGGPLEAFPDKALEEGVTIGRIAELMAMKGKPTTDRQTADQLRLIYVIIPETPRSLRVAPSHAQRYGSKAEEIRSALTAEMQPPTDVDEITQKPA